jgi:exopolysaccharide biosynthesis operon protein EpsL
MRAAISARSASECRAVRRRERRGWEIAVCPRLVGLLALGALQGPAQAQTAPTQDTAKFTPFAEETVTIDDNVFRISDQVDPLTTIGYASRGDTYRTTSAGLSMDVPVSLQRLQATLTYNSYRYDRFHQLDYDGYDLRGSWLWQVGSILSGELGASDNYSLASFAQTLGVAPDRLHAREEFAKGSWLVTPDWKLYAAGDDLVQSTSSPGVQYTNVDLTQYNNVTVDSLEASLSRSAGTGNWFGLDTRYESGHFPVLEQIVAPLGTVLVDNGYSQYGFGVVVDMGSDTPSHVVARADQVHRNYNQVTSRDFNRTTGRLEYTWTPDVKVAVSAIAERDISPYEYIHSSIVMVRGLTLRPMWHATDSIDVSASLAWLDRSYLSDPIVALGAALPRDDAVRSLSALLAYHPASWISVQLSFLHEDRSSNIVFGGYAADVFWLKGRLSL